MARLKGSRWQGDRTVDGTRQRKLFDTKAAAEAWEQGVEPVLRPRLEDVAEAVFQRRWANGNNVKSVRGHLSELFDFFAPGCDIATINTAAVERFKSYLLLERGNAGATVNRKLATLSSILDHARRLGYLDRMPELDYEDEGEGRTRFLTDREVAEFRAGGIFCEWRRVFDFLLATGCRYSEMANMVINEPAWETDPWTVTFKDTKNGKDRIVPLTVAARACLEPDNTLRQIPYDTFHRQWQLIKALSSMKDDPEVTPHVLRHTCASRLVKAGVPIYTVARWLGHRSVRTTERYAHLSVSDFNDAVAALER
jgi:integrase